MRSIVVFVTLLNLVACTTLRTVDGAPSDLQARIASGSVLASGTHAVITTSDGHTHALVVLRVADGTITGANEAVAISDVVEVRKEEFSKGKTIALCVAIGAAIVTGALYLAVQHSGGFTLAATSP